MGYLDDLSGGLRAAAGVLSPDVQKMTMEEDQRNALLRQQQAQMLVQQLAKQVESGSIAPEKAVAALSARGINVPPELLGGPSLAAQKAATDAQREQAFRTEIQALGPNATQEQLAGVAAKHGSAADVLKTQQASIDRQASREATLTAARERIAAQVEAARQRGEDQRAIAKIVQDGRAELARLTASLRPAPAVTTTTVADPNDPSKAIVIDARTGSKIGDAPPKAAAEKALPVSAAQKLMENQQNLRRAEQALALIEGKRVGDVQGDPNATGVKGYTPDAILQRTDPNGVPTRAAIGDLGSLIIHDRSGAAVTAAEFPRLRPFIPVVTDAPETVKKKLSRFVSEYRKVTQEAQDFYKESGYKVPDVLQPSGVNTGPNIDDLVKKYTK